MHPAQALRPGELPLRGARHRPMGILANCTLENGSGGAAPQLAKFVKLAVVVVDASGCSAGDVATAGVGCVAQELHAELQASAKPKADF